MELVIKDPNRSYRRGAMVVAVVLCGLAITQTLIDVSMLPVTCAEIAACLLVCMMGVFGRPYAVLDRNGVTYRLPFRKKFCRWDEVARVGIRNTKATKVPVEYLFPIVIILPGPFKRPLMQELFQTLLIPNQSKIREFVATHYGALDFDDTDGLNNWEKQYYGFKRKP